MLSNKTGTWGNTYISFKDIEKGSSETYHIEESKPIIQATNRIKQILEAKYEPANLEQICSKQKHLAETERNNYQIF